jgi:hypothetical protein
MPSSPSPLIRWGVTVAWVALGGAVLAASRSALEGRGDAAAVVVGAVLWPMWGVGLVAVLVPSTVSLTALRMMTPLSVVACAVSLAGGGSATLCIGALAVAGAVTVLVCSAPVGELFVQASAYGHEQRLPLRLPAALLLPTAVVWLVWAALWCAAVLLLGGRQWVAGGAALAAAIAATWFAGVRLHRFSRRWLVVVPAGVVVHDQVALMETLMVTKPTVLSVGLALADTEAADFTGPAAGHVLQVTLKEMTTVLLPPPQRAGQPKAIHVRSFLVAPSRPGRALQLVGARGIAIG